MSNSVLELSSPPFPIIGSIPRCPYLQATVIIQGELELGPDFRAGDYEPTVQLFASILAPCAS